MKNRTVSQSWRTPPAAISDSEIAREYSADVIVVGLGNSGTPAVRAAAEAGASVIAIEKMEKENFWVFGRDVGHINSDFLAGRGVPRVDPIEFFNEWMRRSGNRANPKLIMQFCQKSGEAFNWYAEPFTRQQLDSILVEYWPVGRRFSGEISGQKFWAGTAQFDDKGVFGPGTVSAKQGQAKKQGVALLFGMDAQQLEGIFSLSHAVLANQERAREHGAVLHFGIDAWQLVLNGERVVGVIARDDKGQYVKYNAKKGVILATGDFSGNKEMCYDLLPDTVDIFDEGEDFKTYGRDGRGIQMGVWAGGRLEARPLAAMGGNFSLPMGVIASFGALWVDENGRRYCNEGFGDPVFAGFPGAYLKRGTITVVFDASIFEDLQYSPPAHMSFWVNNEAMEKRLKDGMAAARAAGAEGYLAGRLKLYAADTLEELADYTGYRGAAKQNFLNTVKRYNEFCATGRDDDFGKDAQLLHALDKPPYYAQPISSGDTIGSFLVTCGGLLTDEYQNVLNQGKDPIPGLYATGNCCGRRFGPQYSTPIAGVSIGIAVTLGREVGRIVAER
jgi:succinate dehydrogenase/fumarate reductase flavoprotein subunit